MFEVGVAVLCYIGLVCTGMWAYWAHKHGSTPGLAVPFAGLFGACMLNTMVFGGWSFADWQLYFENIVIFSIVVAYTFFACKGLSSRWQRLKRELHRNR